MRTAPQDVAISSPWECPVIQVFASVVSSKFIHFMILAQPNAVKRLSTLLLALLCYRDAKLG